MKRVRFESPIKSRNLIMNDSECHSPRPFMERQPLSNPPEIFNYSRVPYNGDPVHRYENSNSSPYPSMQRTHIPSISQKQPEWQPSDDLNLSILDASYQEPREPRFCKPILKEVGNESYQDNSLLKNPQVNLGAPIQLPQKNKVPDPPNMLIKDNSFFIRRDNLDKFHLSVDPLQNQFHKLNLGKENTPLLREESNIKINKFNEPIINPQAIHTNPFSNHCRCHHCVKPIEKLPYTSSAHQVPRQLAATQHNFVSHTNHTCRCMTPEPQPKLCSHCVHSPPPIPENTCKSCNCHSKNASPKAVNAVDKKTWAIEKYEQSKNPDGLEIETQTNVTKGKREPTVADLFKIIKLQNEQLQLLQDKVDRFISSNRKDPQVSQPTEQIITTAEDKEQAKISIGVMTSFEMIRTSTVINKEVVKQSDNVQMQCNLSQISIKEVISKPVNLNFLDGIQPINSSGQDVQNDHNKTGPQTENVGEEKTLNELSLYNVHVDNAITPLMSPEQTMYLDVRDYSESEASGNDQSNVGWTYYNKVMTHVNGMLQDSEMPSSASAMYRNMRQQCLQMQIDKTNVSVTKRVKFGDDPLGLQQPHIYAAPTSDTSLKMNQLAAKYLKSVPAQIVHKPVAKPASATDMSFATRNYMERHKLIQGPPAHSEIPRFLDITALKQQPKFL